MNFSAIFSFAFVVSAKFVTRRWDAATAAVRLVLFSASVDCHYCHGARLKCQRGSNPCIQCKLLVYPVWCSCDWGVRCVWCAISRGVMSVAHGNASDNARKTGFFEDSTDSDNDAERKALLRRVSTSKCVGRLVSCSICCSANNSLHLQWQGVPQLSERGAGWGERACARARGTLFWKINFFNDITYIYFGTWTVCVAVMSFKAAWPIYVGTKRTGSG